MIDKMVYIVFINPFLNVRQKSKISGGKLVYPRNYRKSRVFIPLSTPLH